MAKNLKTAVIIIGIIVVLCIAVQFVCFRVLVIPSWFSKSCSEVDKIELSNSVNTVTVDESDKIEEIYNSIKDTKIHKLKFFPDSGDSDNTDNGFYIIVNYEDGSQDFFRQGGMRRKGLCRENSESDFYWIFGDVNLELKELVETEF